MPPSAPPPAPRGSPSLPAPAGSAGLPRAGAWLLLPAVLLAWPGPGGFLAEDPFPQAAGAGLAALALVPAALGLLVRPGRGALPGAWLGLLVVAAGLLGRTGASDVWEARRALVLGGVAVLSFCAGARLGERETERFVRGAVVLSLAWTGYALLDTALGRDGHLGGVLGNTGPLSQAALPGAVAGAVLFAHRRPAGWWGLAAALAFVAHAAAAPVLAGIAAFLAAGLAAALAAPAGRGRLLVLLVAAGALFGGVRGLARRAPDGAGPSASAQGETGGDTGGLEVRARIWRRTLSLAADHLWTGVGPGQFQAAFPPYRDPAEIELSRHGPCSEEDTEVEHAHQDALQLVAELGVLGGGAALALLLLVLVRSLGGLREASFAAPAAACLALLVNGLAHTPLSVQPASAQLGWALVGLVLARRAAPGAGRSAAAGPWLVRAGAAALLASALLALPLVAHGRALADYVDAVRRYVEAGNETDPDPRRARFDSALSVREASSAVERALAAAPESWPALALEARSAGDAAAWRRLLELRPHAFEAWENLGLLAARAGDVDGATEAWEHALALSPDHVRVTKNLARLELEAGRIDAGLARIGGNPCLDDAWRDELGCELVLKGFLAAGRAVLVTTEPLDPQDGLSPAWAWSQAEAADSKLRASALKALAHWEWAREHAAAGRFDLAARSYRQALTETLDFVPGGAQNLRRELAAAEMAAGRDEDAARHREGLAGPGNEPSLPDWARALLE